MGRGGSKGCVSVTLNSVWVWVSVCVCNPKRVSVWSVQCVGECICNPQLCVSYNYFENYKQVLTEKNPLTKSILFGKIAARWRFQVLQTSTIWMYFTPSLTFIGNLIIYVIGIKGLNHRQVSCNMLCTSKMHTRTGWILYLTNKYKAEVMFFSSSCER